MSISTYSELQTAILSWVRRPDLNGEIGDLPSGTLSMDQIKAGVPDFIRIAESHLNRVLRCDEMSTSTTLSVSNGSASLPASFRQAETLRLSSNPVTSIDYLNKDAFDAFANVDGNRHFFTVSGDSLHVKPWTTDFDVELRFYQEIPALSDSNTTNWLLTKYPDLYLWSAIVATELYGVNDERIKLILPLRDSLIQEINKEAAVMPMALAPVKPRGAVSA